MLAQKQTMETISARLCYSGVLVTTLWFMFYLPVFIYCTLRGIKYENCENISRASVVALNKTNYLYMKRKTDAEKLAFLYSILYSCYRNLCFEILVFFLFFLTYCLSVCI